MTGHTPGPWWFGITKMDDDCNDIPHPKAPDYSGEGYGDNPYIFGADGMRVVGCDEYDVFGDYDDDEARRSADIRLILAAPDLLDALLQVKQDHEDEVRSGGQVYTDIAAINAAIDKATKP